MQQEWLKKATSEFIPVSFKLIHLLIRPIICWESARFQALWLKEDETVPSGNF